MPLPTNRKAKVQAMQEPVVDTSEIAVCRQLFAERYAELHELLEGLTPEGLLWKPLERSPWKGELASVGWLVSHAVSSTVYLLRRAEWILGRRVWDDLDGDEGPEEFGPANHDPAYLAARVQRTHGYVIEFLASLTPADLEASRTQPKRPRVRTVRYDIHHSIEHMSQHIGHAQLTRQLYAAHLASGT